MKHALYSALATRAGGRCECGCGAAVPPGEVDHFFGRAKADESEATCWVLTPRCHYAKTANSPSARSWLERFIAHCERHGYAESETRAKAKLEWLIAKGRAA